MRRVLFAALTVASLLGCTSPEAQRARGGGAGGDPGNHDKAQNPEIHGTRDIFHGTPRRGPGK